ncbi:N(G),N(G)-dimethylarginine dimethylaminohydrolase 1 [Geodia barretti]|uniref:N(G),N(G)-dimethylarginine dimethylaminohydrolase 1 n=1 Tax=Geodia barretti TaxID=519541 RepID=A0AA35WL15_GEOBA|nr:N(G),N(G)-dimethylarginine dimethylaminohydrolase 1 [Geodia barretti]
MSAHDPHTHREHHIDPRSFPLSLQHHVPRLPLCLPHVREHARACHLDRSMRMFCYDLAVVRGVAASLPEKALRQSDSVAVDLQIAQQQHSEYTRVLSEELGLQVVSLPADDLFPDCVFVEDVAVVVDGVALITIPGHESRRGETLTVKEALDKTPGLSVAEMTEPARMDGGDVLFTGREFFVGLSDRTNQEGVSQLAKTFPNYSVLEVRVSEGLHLKSFMSMVGPDRIGIGTSPGARLAREQIQSGAKYMEKYEFVEFP